MNANPTTDNLPSGSPRQDPYEPTSKLKDAVTAKIAADGAIVEERDAVTNFTNVLEKTHVRRNKRTAEEADVDRNAVASTHLVLVNLQGEARLRPFKLPAALGVKKRTPEARRAYQSMPAVNALVALDGREGRVSTTALKAYQMLSAYSTMDEIAAAAQNAARSRDCPKTR